MHRLIFLDTETTGNNLLTDRLIQISYSHQGKIISEFFNPNLPISIKAQSITHITNKMIAGKPAFSDSKTKKELEELLKENIIVAHNAQFDLTMLAHENLSAPKFICTLKVARFLDEENKIPEYKLQFLRYYFELEIEATAHSAEGDVLVLQAVFKKLYDSMLEIEGGHEAVINKMIDISGKPSLFKIFTFGKHRGKRVEEVVKTDKSYVEWMLEQKLQNDRDDEDWIHSLKHYLKK
jgi:DNA polymerase III epsilon subunit-like protein